LCALPALWVGLLYDDTALAAADELIRGWSIEDHAYLRAEVPRTALATPFHGRPLHELAREVVALARSGLAARARIDWDGRDETHHVARLEQIAGEARTPAEEKLERFHGPWGGSIDPVFRDYAF
jgi:glutamate--cysteine ligase